MEHEREWNYVSSCRTQFSACSYPFVVAGILALSTWLFTSVMSLEQQVKLLNEGTVHNLEEKVDGLSARIDAMNVILTDLRVSLGGRVRDGTSL